MHTQLTPGFTARPSMPKPILKNPAWMDVSDIARGVGFTVAVEVSVALSDALEPLQSEDDEDYDQRLYDALWLAHHYLSLDLGRQSFTFTFDFLRKGRRSTHIKEASLRLRVEMQKQAVLLGLSQDFQEAP